MSAPVLTGSLLKKSTFRQWPSRQLSVSRGILQYQRAKGIFNKEDVLVSISLINSMVGEAPEMKRAGRSTPEFVFKLASEGTDKIHYFAAGSREEMSSWISAIGQCGATIEVPGTEEMVLGSAKTCPFTRIWVNTDDGMLREAERLVFAECKTKMQQMMIAVGPGMEMNTWTNIDGDGKPPLVLMHGWGASCVFWYRSVDLLSAHFKLYIADWVGFGRSSSVAYSGRFCEEAEKYWLQPFESWTDALGLEAFALAGHSLGGYLCCKYAAARPAKVNMLILVSPGGTTHELATTFQVEKHASSEPVEAAAASDAVEEVGARHDEHESVADHEIHSFRDHGDSSGDDHSANDAHGDALEEPHSVQPLPPRGAAPPAALSNPRVRNFVWNLSPSSLLRKLGPYGRKMAMRTLKQRWGDHTTPAFTLYTYHMFVRSGGHPGEDATRHVFKPIALPYHPLEECVANLQMPSLWLFGANIVHALFFQLLTKCL